MILTQKRRAQVPAATLVLVAEALPRLRALAALLAVAPVPSRGRKAVDLGMEAAKAPDMAPAAVGTVEALLTAVAPLRQGVTVKKSGKALTNGRKK